jgi:predicted amidohydrolase
MKIAAYQAPLLPVGSKEAIGLIRRQIDRCESDAIGILCCPEAILGGLADHSDRPSDIAIDAAGGQLEVELEPLKSKTVTTIVGFTETVDGSLYNSAAVFHRGSVTGIYRKRHPAINRSVYKAGEELSVFQVSSLTFGILICNDSNFSEDAALLVSKGARVLFIPTNNGLPYDRSRVDEDARRVDISLAKENGVAVVRADVAGKVNGLVSYGSSEIINAQGRVVASAMELEEDLLVWELPL